MQKKLNFPTNISLWKFVHDKKKPRNGSSGSYGRYMEGVWD